MSKFRKKQLASARWFWISKKTVFDKDDKFIGYQGAGTYRVNDHLDYPIPSLLKRNSERV